MAERARRGELWLVALGAGRYGEPGKTRPAVVVSSDELTIEAPDDLVVVVPVSSSRSPSALRVDIPENAGLDRPSRAICRAIRAVAAGRLVRRIGELDRVTLAGLDSVLRLLLELDRQAEIT